MGYYLLSIQNVVLQFLLPNSTHFTARIPVKPPCRRLHSCVLILLLGVLCSPVFPQTQISSNQTWASDTVFVNEDLIVDPGYTLTIAPGTVVLFASQVNLLINGTLKAEGSAELPIIFSGIDSVQWGGIRINYTSNNSTLKFCKISYSSQRYGGAVQIVGQKSDNFILRISL